MNAPARHVLQGLHKTKASPWVLPARDDPARSLSKTAMETAWQRIRSAAGIPDVRLHDLRHTFGSYAGHAGANSFLARELLRHKDISMTARYVNRADAPMRMVSEQVGARIAAGLAGREGAEIVPLKRGA
jgi:integrase